VFASHLESASWRKSSYSGTGGECVEVADGFPHVIPVRDSKTTDAPVLLIPAPGWATFVAALKHSHTIAS
jgi:uncharacterized protein DUF397